MFQDQRFLWLLWLYYGLGPDDPAEWGRARLAWQYQLSWAEVQLAELITAGYTNDEIAERLEIAEINTVKNRINRLFEKMNVDNRVRIAVIAARFGLGPTPSTLSRPAKD